MERMTKILGIDAGNNQVKVFDGKTTDIFLSYLGEYRELKLSGMISKDDMIYEYGGVKGFAGTLAKRESEFGGAMLGSNKAHPDVLIRVLLALHRATDKQEESFNIITGQPIINHTDKYKKEIKDMLLGEHTFTLNNETKKLTINRVEIAAEGASAYWSAPKEGKVRIIDVGSGTVNLATIDSGVYIDKECDTLPFGMNTNISSDVSALVRKIAIQCLKKWKRNDQVYLAGGAAVSLNVEMLYHFPQSKALRPAVQIGSKVSLLDPVYANAVAFYNIGKKVYGNVVQH